MGRLANIEGPNEISHYVAFHQDSHCLQRQNQSSEKDAIFYSFMEITTCDPSVYTMNNPDIFVCSFMVKQLY